MGQTLTKCMVFAMPSQAAAHILLLQAAEGVGCIMPLGRSHDWWNFQQSYRTMLQLFEHEDVTANGEAGMLHKRLHRLAACCLAEASVLSGGTSWCGVLLLCLKQLIPGPRRDSVTVTDLLVARQGDDRPPWGSTCGTAHQAAMGCPRSCFLVGRAGAHGLGVHTGVPATEQPMRRLAFCGAAAGQSGPSAYRAIGSLRPAPIATSPLSRATAASSISAPSGPCQTLARISSCTHREARSSFRCQRAAGALQLGQKLTNLSLPVD
jgi:hypothetical protein